MDNKQRKLQQCLGVSYDPFPSFPCNPMHESRKGTPAKPRISDTGDPRGPGSTVRVPEESLMIIQNKDLSVTA